MKFQSAKRKATPSSVSSFTRETTREEITARAQAIWEQKGRPEGRDDEIWLEAEQQLRSQPAGNGVLRESEQDAEDATKLADRLDDTGEPTGRRSATSL